MALDTIQQKLGLTDRARHIDRHLDDAVAESFPASDPVSLAQPHDPVELGHTRPWSTASWVVVGGGLLALLALIAMRR